MHMVFRFMFQGFSSSLELQLDLELYPHPFLGLYTHIMCATEPRIKNIKYILPKFFNNYVSFGTEFYQYNIKCNLEYNKSSFNAGILFLKIAAMRIVTKDRAHSFIRIT